MMVSSRNAQQHNKSTLLAAAAAAATWGSIAATTYAIRRYRRYASKKRESQIAASENGGGLMPQCGNAVDALAWRAQHTPDKLALEACDGQTRYTYREYYTQVQQFARALLATTASNDSSDDQWGVAIHAFNEPRWFFAAMGALAAEWTVSGIYLTNTYPQAAHVLKTSNVQVLVLESEDLLQSTYQTVLKDFPQLTVVLLHGASGDSTGRVLSYDAFLSKGAYDKTRPANATALPQPQQLSPNTVTSLVYTSGTTGNPKAVSLTHENVRSVCAMMHARIPLDESTKVVSYLPLSHIAAMGIDLYSSIFCGASVHFADAQALRGSLKNTLVRVRPTLFFGVPRVWEKMATAMQTAASKSYAKPVIGPMLKSIGTAAKAVGKAWWSADTPEWMRCGFLVIPFGFFQLLAYRKVRKACGLDRCPLLYTGAAPLSADTMWYLRSLNMPLLEVFGMSESTGAIAVCGPNDRARPMGACGRALPNGTLEMNKEDDEICWKGTNNMVGYKGLPAATRAALHPDTQFLHTGDIGRIDENGYLFITGRKKDLIITAGGENVAPTPIEETFLSLLKAVDADTVGHVILIGDQRKYLTLLLAPSADNKSSLPTPQQIETAVQEYNEQYAKSRAQRVQKAHVLEHPLTVETGELTPTMKVKRAYVMEKYAKEINAMYEDGSNKLVGYSSMNIGAFEAGG